MLPGLWQILVSLGIFASVRSLPRSVALAAAWYFVAGFAVLLIGEPAHALSPWTDGPAVRGRPDADGGACSILLPERPMPKTEAEQRAVLL